VRGVRSVLFPGLDSLVGLARHGVDVKPTLLRVLTDLYVQKPTHSHDEECQYVELALRLIDAVDAETRAAVARRLATYPSAPREILCRLGGEALLPAGHDQTARRAAAKLDEAPAAPAGEKLTKAEATAITQRFFAADAEGRLRLLAALDAQGPLAFASAPVPPADVPRRLEASALAGRPSEFIRELERVLGVTRTLAETIVNDLSGEPLLVVAKVLAIPIDALQRILLFVNPSIGHSVRRVYALTAMFDAISLAGALRLVAAWRQAAPAETRAPLPSREARLARDSTSMAPRSAAGIPSRSTANPVTRNREFGAPSRAPRAPSANDPIKKMTS
jgi:hypothetical protein